MKKALKFFSILFLSMTMILVSSVGIHAEKTEEIILSDDGNQIISVQVNAKDKKSYQKYISNKVNLQAEIDKAINIFNSDNPLARTPGNCKISYYGIVQVYQTMDRLDKNGKWLNYVSNPFATQGISALHRQIAKVFGYSSFWVTLAGFFIGMGTNLHGRQKSWWTESALMISKKEITGVRTKSCENISGNNYPAAYFLIERYK